MKLLKAGLVGIALVASSFVNATVITNTTNDSFIDNNTGLEWMDFGINNQYTPNEVRGLLTTTYVGWSLATQSQVLTLANNAFNVTGATYSTHTTGGYFTRYSADSYINWSTVRAMGFNIVNGTDINGDQYGYSLGWFDDQTNSLSYLYLRSNIEGRYSGYVYGRNVNFDQYNNVNNLYYGTMLVKTANVSAPTTFAIFALGLMGLASRLFKKQS